MVNFFEAVAGEFVQGRRGRYQHGPRSRGTGAAGQGCYQALIRDVRAAHERAYPESTEWRLLFTILANTENAFNLGQLSD